MNTNQPEAEEAASVQRVCIWCLYEREHRTGQRASLSEYRNRGMVILTDCVRHETPQGKRTIWEKSSG